VNSVVRPIETRAAGPKSLLVSLTNEDGELPVHERLYRRIRLLIQSGAIPRGGRLASSRSLARHLGISRNSVLAAVDRLVADGWLESRPGSGVFVSYAGALVGGTAGIPRRSCGKPLALGTRPLDLFPAKLWKQLQSRRWDSIPRQALQLGDALGWPPLREAIATHVALFRGLKCNPNEVIVTTSVPAAIDLAVRALELTGADVWVEDPSYHASKRALQNCGVRMIPIPTDAEGLDVGFAEREAPNARAALVTPACQFPTCVSMSNQRRKTLSRWASDKKAWILEDDYDWQSSDQKRLPAPLAASNASRTIYIDSFNSTLFPALRIAYMICPLDVIDRFAAVRLGLDEHSNVPNQLILTDFIEGGHLDHHIKRLAAAYPERREALLECLERELCDVLTVHRRTIGTHVVASLHTQRESEFVSACAAEGVAMEAMGFYRIRSVTQQEILFGYAGFSPKEIQDAVATIRRAAMSLDRSRGGRMSDGAKQP
jgi:GntR family transcriptional regulator/MocR family aminotransferase